MNLPSLWMDRMQQQLGPEMQAFVGAHAEPATRALRYNPAKPYSHPDLPAVPWAIEGHYVSKSLRAGRDPFFHAGAYYVQEPSSMVLSQILAKLGSPFPIKRVLDAAAAPGGKTTILMDAFPSALVVANEVIGQRVGSLLENLTRWGAPNSCVTSNDIRHFQRLPFQFDLILLDAPCSGEGLFRKSPEAISEWSPGQAHHCALRQTRILEDTVPLLGPGGYLLYSTCTFNPEENWEQVEKLLTKHPELETWNVPVDPAWNLETQPPGASSIHGLQVYPHRQAGEGFFLAILRKKPESDPLDRGTARKNRKLVDLSPWLKDPESWHQLQYGSRILVYPAEFDGEVMALRESLHLRRLGIPILQQKGQVLVPLHDLALSWIRNPGLPALEMDVETARRYLSHEPLAPGKSADPGWLLATVAGLGLGWVKQTRRELKNHHPIQLRIRDTRSHI